MTTSSKTPTKRTRWSQKQLEAKQRAEAWARENEEKENSTKKKASQTPLKKVSTGAKHSVKSLKKKITKKLPSSTASKAAAKRAARARAKAWYEESLKKEMNEKKQKVEVAETTQKPIIATEIDTFDIRGGDETEDEEMTTGEKDSNESQPQSVIEEISDEEMFDAVETLHVGQNKENVGQKENTQTVRIPTTTVMPRSPEQLSNQNRTDSIAATQFSPPLARPLFPTSSNPPVSVACPVPTRDSCPTSPSLDSYVLANALHSVNVMASLKKEQLDRLPDLHVPKLPQLHPIPESYVRQHQLQQCQPKKHDVQTGRFTEAEEITKNRHPYLIAFSVLSLVLVLSFPMFYGIQPEEDSPVPNLDSDNSIGPCFLDNVGQASEFETIPTVMACNDLLPRISCPLKAMCAGGILRSCYSPYMEIAEKGDSCVLIQEAEDKLFQLEEILKQWTTQELCNILGCKFTRRAEKSSSPQFSISDLDELGVDEELLSLSSFLIISRDENDNLLAQFSAEYMDQQFSLPLRCSLVRFLKNMFLKMLPDKRTLLGIVTVLVTILLANPLATLSFLLMVLIVVYRQNRVATNERLTELVVRVRAIVYDRLAEEEECVAIFLRDEIAMNMFGNSLKDRYYLITKVWPRVVLDIRRDNRISKLKRMCNDRKVRDIWKGQYTLGKEHSE